MSKLADLIRKTTHQAPAPLGFAPAAREVRAASMLCVVRLSDKEAGKAADAVEQGADVLIIDGDAGKTKDALKKAGKAPIGAHPARVDANTVSSLREAGADFVWLDGDAPAEALVEERIGFVLTPRMDADDTHLRLLGDLGLDALALGIPRLPLTLEGMLSLRRAASLARTPLLVDLPVDAEPATLKAVRDSGAVGVIVDGSSIAKLARLREAISALPARGRKREERTDATIPAGATASHDHDDHDDDD